MISQSYVSMSSGSYFMHFNMFLANEFLELNSNAYFQSLKMTKQSKNYDPHIRHLRIIIFDYETKWKMN